MIKVTAYASTVLFAIFSFGVVALASPTLTYAQSEPELTIESVVTTATSTTYAVHLLNKGDIFNVVEFDLRFASNTQMTTGSIESALCRPEFTIANTLSTTTGSWYVACGTFIPFSGASTTIATFTILNTETAPNFSFGTDTALYRHDGLGTKVTPFFKKPSTATSSAQTIL